MKLTEHFTLAELVASSTARRLGLDNTPTADALQQLHRTAQMLERVRSFLGGKAVIVTSGYRNRQVNAAVGGVTSSDHAQGMAGSPHTAHPMRWPRLWCRRSARWVSGKSSTRAWAGLSGCICPRASHCRRSIV